LNVPSPERKGSKRTRYFSSKKGRDVGEKRKKKEKGGKPKEPPVNAGRTRGKDSPSLVLIYLRPSEGEPHGIKRGGKEKGKKRGELAHIDGALSRAAHPSQEKGKRGREPLSLSCFTKKGNGGKRKKTGVCGVKEGKGRALALHQKPCRKPKKGKKRVWAGSEVGKTREKRRWNETGCLLLPHEIKETGGGGKEKKGRSHSRIPQPGKKRGKKPTPVFPC